LQPTFTPQLTPLHPQLLIYYYYQGAWVLPVAGFIVGYATNWIALKLIFEPANPINLRCFRLQGLFIKRQAEVSQELSKMATQEFLQQADMWREICYGKGALAWQALVARVIESYVADVTSRSSALRLGAALALGDDRLTRIRTTVRSAASHASRAELNCIADVPPLPHAGRGDAHPRDPLHADTRVRVHGRRDGRGGHHARGTSGAAPR